MKHIFIIPLLFMGAGCANNIPDVKPEPIIENRMSEIERTYVVGGWEVLTSKTDGFDAIILDESGTYFAHLKERPLDEGTWTYDGQTLNLTSNSSEKFNYSYTNIDRKGGEYLLLDRVDIEGEAGERTWQRRNI